MYFPLGRYTSLRPLGGRSTQRRLRSTGDRESGTKVPGAKTVATRQRGFRALNCTAGPTVVSDITNYRLTASAWFARVRQSAFAEWSHFSVSTTFLQVWSGLNSLNRDGRSPRLLPAHHHRLRELQQRVGARLRRADRVSAEDHCGSGPISITTWCQWSISFRCSARLLEHDPFPKTRYFSGSGSCTGWRATRSSLLGRRIAYGHNCLADRSGNQLPVPRWPI
jgi:hypothetical protein